MNNISWVFMAYTVSRCSVDECRSSPSKTGSQHNLPRKGPWEVDVVPSSFLLHENGGFKEGCLFSRDICNLYFLTSSELFVRDDVQVISS